MLGKEHALQRGELRVAEEELPLGLPSSQIERLGSGCRRILCLSAQPGKLGPLPSDVESQGRQPLSHFLELEERAL